MDKLNFGDACPSEREERDEREEREEREFTTLTTGDHLKALD